MSDLVIPRRTAGLGWLPDPPDPRDHLYAADAEEARNIPAEASCWPTMPQELWNQLDMSACTGWGLKCIYQQALKKEGLSMVEVSALALYYEERKIEGTINSDAGAFIRDGLKVLATTGVCQESAWPYDASKWATAPPADCYTYGQAHKAIRYKSVPQSLTQIQACIASGWPIIFGFSVPESFMSEEMAQSGDMPIPSPTERIVGGHCVVAFRYSNQRRKVKCMNWWSNPGDVWGDKTEEPGSFWMPYEVLTNPDMAGDLWTLRLVS